MKLLLLTTKFKNSGTKSYYNNFMLKPLRKKLAVHLLILFPVLFFSCLEKELDFDSIKGKRWAAHWAVPLVNSNLTIDDFLNDSTSRVLMTWMLLLRK